MRTRVQVTLSHIRRGTRYHLNRSALGLAINDRLKRGIYSGVLVSEVPRFARVWFDGDSDGAVKLSYRANRWARRFDRLGANACRPFTFTLDIPREMVRVRA